MARTLRSTFAALWATVGVTAGVLVAIWWDRASARGQVPDLSGWGGGFVVGAVVLIVGIFAAYWLVTHNHNEAGIVMCSLCTALVTLGFALLAPQIGWAASFRLGGLLAGAIFYLAIHFWIAWR